MPSLVVGLVHVLKQSAERCDARGVSHHQPRQQRAAMDVRNQLCKAPFAAKHRLSGPHVVQHRLHVTQLLLVCIQHVVHEEGRSEPGRWL